MSEDGNSINHELSPQSLEKGFQVKVEGAEEIFNHLQKLSQDQLQKIKSIRESDKLTADLLTRTALPPSKSLTNICHKVIELPEPASLQSTYLKYFQGNFNHPSRADIESIIKWKPGVLPETNKILDSLKKQDVDFDLFTRDDKTQIGIKSGGIAIFITIDGSDIRINTLSLENYREASYLWDQFKQYQTKWKWNMGNYRRALQLSQYNRQAIGPEPTYNNDAEIKAKNYIESMTRNPSTINPLTSNSIDFRHKFESYAEIYGKFLNSMYEASGITPPDIDLIIGIQSKIQERVPKENKNIQNTTTENKQAEPVPTKLDNLFSRLPDQKPENNDSEYFISSKETLMKMELVKPFFTNIKLNPDGTFSFAVNREVVPYVYEPIAQTERFQQAEASTGGDSGLFAICAVSAETPEKQAEVYSNVAKTILKVHENNPKLLINWIGEQTEQNNENDFPPFYVFISFDHKITNGIPQPRPEQEQLVAFMMDPQTGDFDFAKFEEKWKSRIDELKTVFKTGDIQPHHIRWVEFLSHSIDKPKLFEAVKLKLI